MVAGIDRWDVTEPDLHEPRLEQRLQRSPASHPPATPTTSTVTATSRSCGFPDGTPARVPRLARPLAARRRATRTCAATATDRLVPVALRRRLRARATSTTSRTCVGARGAPARATHCGSVDDAAHPPSLRDIVIECSCGAARSSRAPSTGRTFARSHAVRAAVLAGRPEGELRAPVCGRCSAARRTSGSRRPSRAVDPAVVRRRVPGARQPLADAQEHR